SLPLGMTPSPKWMSALSDDETRLNTNANCVSFVDTAADGDIKLVVADLGTSRYEMKLKVFKALTKVGEQIMVESPVSTIAFNNESLPSNTIGVAAGSTFYIYKALKPYYKFELHPSALLPSEIAAWTRYWKEGQHMEQLVNNLQLAADEVSFSSLSSHSQAIVMGSDEDRESLVNKVSTMSNRMPVNKSQLTSLSSLRRSTDISLVDVVVMGCENGDICFLDTQAFQILASINLGSPIVFLVCSGSYDVDFRVFATTRNGGIYAIRRDNLSAGEAKQLASLTRRIVSIKMFAKILAVATDDNKITYYNLKGKRLKEIRTPSRIIGLETFTYEPKQYSNLMVAFQREICMYSENSLVDTLKVDADIKWIKFGSFGREEAALIIGTKSGGIIVKLFRRMAVLTDIADLQAPKLAHNYKLNIPKRTKLYIDQAQRERDNPVHMHQMYQRDLFLLRWLVSQQFSLMTTKALSTVSTSSSEAVDISVDVNGFGPIFRLSVRLSSGTETPLTDMWLSFIYKKESFKVSDSLIPVSLLTPGHFYTFTLLVEAVSPEKGLSSDIKIYLCRKSRPNPIVTAIITMPLSEMSLLD
ncbi:hypothetical protein PENTCL1PPCAC_23095, partial [Pristionchus entomophagus]